MVDITYTDLEIIKNILADTAPEAEVVVFGSRVLGTAQQYSDLDLAVKTSENDREVLEKLRDAFSESDLSIMIDVIDYNRASERFRTIIDSTCCELTI
ncbi:MAG: nucleotidyltransferase domain-containing protein [Bacillota bacterium]